MGFAIVAPPFEGEGDLRFSTQRFAEVCAEVRGGECFIYICDELQAIQLDSFREYDLIKIDADADVEPIVLLKMICPSTGYTHVLRVPPSMESAKEAITWVNWGIDPNDFAVES